MVVHLDVCPTEDHLLFEFKVPCFTMLITRCDMKLNTPRFSTSICELRFPRRHVNEYHEGICNKYTPRGMMAVLCVYYIDIQSWRVQDN